MTEKKSIASFFEKRVLRPSKNVNYLIQELDLEKVQKVQDKEAIIQENIKEMKVQVKDSQDLTRMLLNGKTVNPFFDKKMVNVGVKEEVLEFMEPLTPNYEDCHVGHEYVQSKHDIFTLFPRKIHESVTLGDYEISLAHDVSTPWKRNVSKISMTKMELNEYLNTQFSSNVLEEPCIQAMYNRLLESKIDDGLQWNDKYAPKCSQEFLGCTNRIYASSLLTYLQEWKPKKIHVQKKVPRFHQLDDLIVSDVDSDFDGFAVSNKHQLIIGPPGSGKTALVAAVAKEAEISILEIHTGIKRSGKELISTLGETASSRIVGDKKASMDPNWFQEKPSITKKRRKRIVTSSGDEESDWDHIDLDSPKKPQKKNQKKRSLAEPKKDTKKPQVGITSFFNSIPKASKKPLDENVIAVDIIENEANEAVAKKPRKQSQQEKPMENSKKDITSFFKPAPKAGITTFFKPIQEPVMKQSSKAISESDSPTAGNVIVVDDTISSPPPRFHGSRKNEPKIEEPSADESRIASSRKTVILLDSVDVITEQDKGFWNGVATLFESSRRPIILICNENPFIANNSSIPSSVLEFLSNSVESFQICPPEEEELTCYLTLLLLNEGILLDPSLIRKICAENRYDIRQIILFLQMSTRMDDSLIIRADNCFQFYKIESFSLLSSLSNDSSEVWKPCSIPATLDDALLAFDAISCADHRIKSSYFSDWNMEFSSTNSGPSDCSSLFPVLSDDLFLPIQTASKDVQTMLDISSRITDILDKRWKEGHVANCITTSLLFYDFPTWPFMKDRLTDTSNLFFWDGSIQVPRCFITEMLPWLSVMLQHSHLVAEREGYMPQKGRTRRSNRKTLRLFESELSDEQFQSVAKRWF